MDINALLQRGRLLFDGGMGTMLQAAGLEAGDCPEMLNITHPAEVSRIHEQYARAGALVLETNSLGLNGVALGKKGLAERLEELTHAAVRCARDAVGEGVLVALSVGPTGGILAPFGEVSFEACYEGYRRQIAAGADAGADLVFIETMGDIAEARIAALAARECCRLPMILSFTYQAGGRMLMGGTPQCAAIEARAMGAVMVGANCSGGPEQLLDILRKTREVSSLPMVIQPNAGLPLLREGKTTFPLEAAQMAALMRPLLEEGASAIGGCCGTTPEHISAFGELLRDYPALPSSDIRQERVLCNQRRWLLPSQLTSLPEMQASPEALYDADPSAQALLLDFGDMSPEEAGAFVLEASAMARAPLCFALRGDEQAEAVLRRYAGVAGVRGPVSEDVLERYGAVRFDF